MRILISNDDGIHSEGLLALEQKLKALGETFTVAPDRVQNSMSHALTLHRPLRADEIGHNRFSIDGTPTDCVKRIENTRVRSPGSRPVSRRASVSACSCAKPPNITWMFHTILLSPQWKKN